jgi:excisionase family DNA binding protein
VEKAAAVTALTDLLALPEQVAQLRAEVAELKEMLRALHVALPPSVVSIAEAALKLGFNQRSVRRMLAEGRLRSVRVGGRVRIDLASVQEALMLRVSDLSTS